VNAGTGRDLHFSFFMFTADLRPRDPSARARVIDHVRELTGLGYVGFDVPVAPPADDDWAAELEAYRTLRRELDAAGFEHIPLTTNVGATQLYDPSSPDEAQRGDALRYLKSRVDITAALYGPVLAGPILFPYAVFPSQDGEPLWSDALQDWAAGRTAVAAPVLNELAEYAAEQGVSLAIEPVDHWETPWPNMVGEILTFLESVPSRQLGVCVDSAHVMLGGDGPAAFAAQIGAPSAAGRIHSVHVSPPDRGAFRDSWLPWQQFFEPVLAAFDGPLLVETFNAVPPFSGLLRLSRRKFWVPGDDSPVESVPDAYTIAAEAIETVRGELARAKGAR
jgi:sugar phosphate isomerase/epimerase